MKNFENEIEGGAINPQKEIEALIASLTGETSDEAMQKL